MRALAPVVTAAVVAAALVGVARDADAGGGARAGGASLRQKILAPLRKLHLPRRRGPALLAEGSMSRAYVSGDGKRVMKRIKPVLQGIQRITEEGRVALARRTVEGMDLLRDAGIPVPAARVSAMFPGTIVQDRVTDGLTIDQLSPAAERAARRNLKKITLRAWRVLWPRGYRGWVDSAPSNMRFDADGNIVSWFDPIYAISAPRAIWMSQVRRRVYGWMGWGPERSKPWGPDDL